MTDEELLAFLRKALNIPPVHTLLLLDRGHETYAVREVSPDSPAVERYGHYRLNGSGYSIQDNVAPILDSDQQAVHDEVKALVENAIQARGAPERRSLKILSFNDYPHIFKKDWAHENLWGGVLPEMHSALWVLMLQLNVRGIDLSFNRGKNGHDLTIQSVAPSRI